MDEMRLESKFTTGLVSKIARTVVRKKLGYDMDIRLNRLRTTVVDEKDTRTSGRRSGAHKGRA